MKVETVSRIGSDVVRYLGMVNGSKIYGTDTTSSSRDEGCIYFVSKDDQVTHVLDIDIASRLSGDVLDIKEIRRVS